MQVASFHLKPMVHYGAGACELAGSELRRLGSRRPLVVSDPGVLAAGVAGPVLASLREAGLEGKIFDGVATNPTDEMVMGAVTAYRGAGADALVGLGGGSPMDVAKSAAAVVAGGGRIGDYEDGRRTAAGPAPPLLFVPTTAGTGSEVVGGTIITDTRRRFKMHVVAVPGDVALCDPGLTLTLPAPVTAATGLDALSHAIGAYVSVEHQPLSDAYALYAIEQVRRWLPRALADGGDLAARSGMMVASLTAGISMKGGGSGEHAFAHGVNVRHGLHHGVGCAVFLADVMEFNLARADAALTARYGRVAEAMGVGEPSLADGERARRGIDAVRRLVADSGIPHLSALGVSAADVGPLVEYVLQDAFHLSLNPVAIDADDAEAILARALVPGQEAVPTTVGPSPSPAASRGREP